MKKLLSVISAVGITATSATTLVSCSTTLLTNTYTIALANSDELYNQISFTWNNETGNYEVSDAAEIAKISENDKISKVKESLSGASVNSNLGNVIIQSLMNVLFFNAETTIVNSNRSLSAYQYVFATDHDGLYVDGQLRTTGQNTNNEDFATQYYQDYDASGLGIASILGLYEYWQHNTSSNNTHIPDLISNDSGTQTQKMSYIDSMFSTSSNQAIKSVTFKQNSKFVDGSIATFTPSTTSSTSIDAYNHSWISKTDANYSSKMDYEKDYKNYIAGTSLTLDPFSHILLSDAVEGSVIKNSNLHFTQVETDKITASETPGHIFTNEEVINVQYGITQSDGKNTAVSSNLSTSGYQLVKLNPIEMEIIYNTDVRLTSGATRPDDYLGDDYKINLTVDGLYAYYLPVMNFISNDATDSLKNNQQVYVGWQLMGYQFNGQAIKGFDKDGKALKNSFKPNDDSLQLYDNPFSDMSITNFDISKEASTNE